MLSPQTNSLKHSLSPSNNKQTCPVCLSQNKELYSLSSCSHYFCQQCCLSYIQTQADNFSIAKCLQQGCNSKLDKSKEIYTKVSQKTKNKIQKHQLFKFLQLNPQYIQCSQQSCNGYFQKKPNFAIFKSQCVICHVPHCSKCLNIYHLTPNCPISSQSQQINNQMQKLNYKKCPKCSIWVQKSQGCNYIDCKCQCKFCYKCGNQFDKDPCRKKDNWKKNNQIRQLMNQIKINIPQNAKQFITFLPKIIIQTLLTIIFTIFYSFLIISIFLLILTLITLFSPLALLIPAFQIQHKTKKILAISSIIIFYPILVGLMGFTLINVVLFYPCLKNTYHHGVYDPLDSGVSNVAVCYVKVLGLIWK